MVDFVVQMCTVHEYRYKMIFWVTAAKLVITGSS